KPNHMNRMHIELPGTDHDQDRGKAARFKSGRILKLHGSVDWKKSKNSQGVQYWQKGPQEDFAIRAPADEIAIATPGPHKSATTKEFQWLWRAAKEAIRAAEAIVFIGYSFPVSDAVARGELLRAIEANQSQDLSVHIVLGTPGPHSERVRHMVVSMCE